MPKKAVERERIPIAPSDFLKGGGVPDGEHTITESEWVVWDYQGKAAEVVALHWRFDDEYDQYYSGGTEGTVAFEPAEDGLSLVRRQEEPDNLAQIAKGARPPTTAEKLWEKCQNMRSLSSNCNAALAINSAVDAGWPEDKLKEEGMDQFIGAVVTIENVSQPKRGGLVNPKEEQREKTIALISGEIVSYPWDEQEKPKKSSKSSGKPNGKVRAKEESEEEEEEEEGEEEKTPSAEDRAAALVKAVLKEQGKGAKIARGPALNRLVLEAAKEADDPTPSVMVNLCLKNSFLESIDGVYFDGKSVSLAK